MNLKLEVSRLNPVAGGASAGMPDGGSAAGRVKLNQRNRLKFHFLPPQVVEIADHLGVTFFRGSEDVGRPDFGVMERWSVGVCGRETTNEDVRANRKLAQREAISGSVETPEEKWGQFGPISWNKLIQGELGIKYMNAKRWMEAVDSQ